ncbi:DUF2312 domain-containing protein [Rhizobium halophilum]|uniref:DUF2312 domain-containing protein n=1 Tax=Rhizobium halophilum TaxID=2846852 RepID=UPI001EFCCE62|nr:GapR family DNA-binding domain-containing protein [Rhizobium halophilum]MCF6368322.1 DUF2312 domain-containing protein [Rhizobium halophilum]
MSVSKEGPARVEGSAVNAAPLRAFVERIERLEEEENAIKDDKADVYGEAKSLGYDKKALKRVVAARRKDPQQRKEEDLIFETYMHALGEDV